MAINGTPLPITKVGTSMMIGDYSGGNYTEFTDKGEQILHGTAIAWIDMYGDISGKKLQTTVGTVDTDYEQGVMKFQKNGDITSTRDRVMINVQNNHQFKIAEGGSLIGVIFHFHWMQPILNDIFIVTLQTRLLKNGKSFDINANWNEIAVQTATYDNSDINVGGDVFPKVIDNGHTHMNQITTFPVINTDFGLSDTIQVRMAREDSNNGDLLVSFFDTHLPVNGFGSNSRLSKY